MAESTAATGPNEVHPHPLLRKLLVPSSGTMKFFASFVDDPLTEAQKGPLYNELPNAKPTTEAEITTQTLLTTSKLVDSAKAPHYQLLFHWLARHGGDEWMTKTWSLAELNKILDKLRITSTRLEGALRRANKHLAPYLSTVDAADKDELLRFLLIECRLNNLYDEKADETPLAGFHKAAKELHEKEEQEQADAIKAKQLHEQEAKAKAANDKEPFAKAPATKESSVLESTLEYSTVLQFRILHLSSLWLFLLLPLCLSESCHLITHTTHTNTLTHTLNKQIS